MARFEWDEENARKHWLKHRISFEDAQLIFEYPNRLSKPDRRYPYLEERWQTIRCFQDG